MKDVICKKCNKPMDLVTTKTEIQLICRNPVFAKVVATCSHCGEDQVIAAMDQEQMDAFKRYLDLQRKIRLAGRNHWRPRIVKQMTNEATTLLAYMEARAPELMDKYIISQQLREKWKERGEIVGKK